MSTVTYPNGQTLTSSALTPVALATLLQPLIAQALGIDPTAPTAWSAVRIDWPTVGQPVGGISEDICFIRATADNAPFSRVRDQEYSPLNSQSLTQNMGFTQVWNLHLTAYGPNCFDRLREIVSAFSFDWLCQSLAAANLYPVPDWQRPQYAPDLFQGQWWPRADVDLKLYESVTESTTAPSAAGVDVTLQPDTGAAVEFEITA
ncbi:MAG TPA: hypothetical protein VN736_00400 [Candidatus Limnocylindrales bacterium]|nr:hypothetical protein [Candidatus Limnocylindrales bacterium]